MPIDSQEIHISCLVRLYALQALLLVLLLRNGCKGVRLCFFIISAYGAFTPGYLLIISKDFIPSYGLIKESDLRELNFIIKLIKEIINQELSRNSVVFEHGMCACVPHRLSSQMFFDSPAL